MTRVFKTDAAGTAQAITLHSARREYEPFQVAVRAPEANDLTNVNVTVSDLVGPGVIGSSNITLYREYYVYVTTGSKTSDATTNFPLGPGWYPDGLIPFVDPATGEDLTGTLDAVPFDLTSGENQPIWIDVFTPPRKPPGRYEGTVSVTSDQGTASVSVTLDVWNFRLPRRQSLHTFTSLDLSRNTLVNDIMLLEHGFNPKNVDDADEENLRDDYGLDRTQAYPASGATYGHCVADPPPAVADVRREAAKHASGLYLFDPYANEVWDCVSLFPTFMDWATALRAGGIHPQITTYPVHALMGPDLDHTAADIWSILPKHYDQAVANIDRLVDNPSTEVWSYNPLVQDGYSPKYTIDFLPINARIMHGFINQSLGFTGTKMWRVDYWTADPWNNKEAAREDAPGEGDLTYPGDPVGLPGYVLPGIRLKWFREGVEDFEYIAMLGRMGKRRFALDITHQVATDFHTWTQDKDVLYTAREILGDKLSRSVAASNTPGR